MTDIIAQGMAAKALKVGAANALSNTFQRPGSFAKWNAAKARGASNPARFAMVGDSNTTGTGSATGTAGLTGAASTGMTRQLGGLLGYRTDHFFGDQNCYGAGVALGTYDPRLTLGTGWAPESIASYAVVPGGRFLIATAPTSGLLRFTPALPFSKFRFWVPTNPGLNTAMTVAVDGTIVDTFSIATAASNTYRDYTVTPGTHYIEIGASASSGNGYVLGIETFDGSATPHLLQLGDWGVKIAGLNTATNVWNAAQSTVALAPDYTVLYCTINDSNATTALATYYAAVEQFLTTMAPGSDGCLTVGFPSATSGNTISGFLDGYATALRNLAREFNWSFYDCRQDVGFSNARAAALNFRYDNDHPNYAGHTAIATGLYNFLIGAGL